MTTLRILAVDDEQLALRRLDLLLRKIVGVELIGTARSGPQALDLITRLKPDVILLDIRMAGMSGFEVVTALEGPDPPEVIFVTAFDSFAAQAFELSPVDYVVKPVDLDRLRRAIDRARRRLEASEARLHIDELTAVVAALRSQAAETASGGAGPPAEIWVQRRGEFARLLVRDIDWVEAERDYVRLHARGESYLLRHTLAALHERLGERFLRIRRSALVRTDRIAAVRRAGYGDLRVKLVTGEELRVGGAYVAQVRAMLNARTSPVEEG